MGVMSSSQAQYEQASKSKNHQESSSDSKSSSDLQPYNPTLADTALVRTMLMRCFRQPAELADSILENASYAPRLEIAMPNRFAASAKVTSSRITTKLTEEQRVTVRKRTGTDKLAVTTTYDGPGNSVAALCLVTEPVPRGRWAGEDVVVKKVRFWMRSRDQGWGGPPAWRATYRGSYSWLEAVIIRPLPGSLDSSIPTPSNDNQDNPSSSNVPYDDKLDSELLEITTPSPLYPDPPTFEAHYLEPRGYQLVSRKRPNHKGKRWEGKVKDKEEEEGKTMKKTWTIQQNLVAVAQAREHEVEWRDDNGNHEQGLMVDSSIKKGAESDHRSGYVVIGNNDGDDDDKDKDDETGKGNGRGFVQALRPGDRIGVLARALFPGWSVTVENLKVEMNTCVRY